MQALEVGGTIVEDRVEAGVGDVMQGCRELGGRMELKVIPHHDILPRISYSK
uniref:Uncharacterized protein n=1 Tax=Oryza sativa subsp. japonica TaxID=39947 RepID=Q6YTZ8_ORYSJ|nr:hypothetical protein [Oryza sativa Japonica Group]BAD17729.1 hypothetical protein [Oryza sativa Japonica Group]